MDIVIKMIVKPKKNLVCTNCNCIIDKEALATPNEIVNLLYKHFKQWGDFDLCATEKTTKFDHYYNKKDDMLKQNFPTCRGTLWCNAPHKQNKKFVLKLFEQWKLRKVKIILLIPINTLCNLYFENILPHVKLKIITRRIKFLCPNCNKPTNLNSVNGCVGVFFP